MSGYECINEDRIPGSYLGMIDIRYHVFVQRIY